MLAAFGDSVLRGKPLSYLQYVQLWLNRDRAKFRQASAVAWGVHAALTSDNLPRAWFEAITETEQEADGLEFEANKGKQDARAKVRYGLF